MESKSDSAPLVVIVGETGSGKSALGMHLAKEFGGEIIAADSRTVYAGMDIGTAKPSGREQQEVRHHLIDVVNPDQEFTAADFKELANKAIRDIYARERLPIMVGGTGLYVDSVLYDFTFRARADNELRQELQDLSIEQLQARLIEQGIPLPNNDRNPRHLVRALETNGEPAAKRPLRPDTLVIGMSIEREVLRERIEHRVAAMMAAGLLGEVEQLVAKYGWAAPGLQSPGYKTFREYLEGKATIGEVRERLIREHMQLAKRQRTWFKRNKSIHWICKKEESVDLVTTFLNKVYTDTARSLLQ
jgi:tRNA dimethylallyltransferase